MQIQHTQQDQAGTFYIQENGDTVAEMTYYLKDQNTMVIDHTEVDELRRGQDIGLKLVEAGVEFARREGLKIIPVCEFAQSVFNKKEELRDVLQ